jgi:DNA repair photolyase
LAAADWRLMVLTRSPLVTRDRAVLSSFSEVPVGLSVPTPDERPRRAVEPGAPSVCARLAALRCLADAGLATLVNAMPLYPWTRRSPPEAMAAAVARAGAGRVYVGPWR